MIRIVGILFLFNLLIFATETLTFGVFIDRTDALTRKEYQPLVNYLNTHLEGYKVTLMPLKRDEMERALHRNQLDLLSTNPSHYEVIRNHNLLTRIIATTQHAEKGVKTENFGGVIFTLPEHTSIHSLRDLENKSIASMDRKSLGAYQAQAYECLQQGIDISRQSRLIFHTNQNAIVDSVLSKKADVGFIRTGVLEAMIHKGKISLQQIHILNQQNMEHFPYILSTRLYPEWPIALMPHLDEKLAKKLSILLLTYHPTSVQDSTIGGFTLPQNYQSITDLTKTLRLPPYDKSETITWKAIYRQYHREIWGILTTTVLMLIALIQIIRLNLRIRSNEERFKLAIEGTKDGLFDWNMRTNEMFHSKHFETMLGYNGDELPQTIKAWEDYVHPDDLQSAKKMIHDYIESKGSKDYSAIFRMRTKEGAWKWIEGKGKVLFDSHDRAIRFVGFNTDITQKRENELKLQYAAGHDLLTNLPNRTLLSNLMPQVLAAAKRHQSHVALLFIDLDGFKEINDNHGHEIGDLLLKEVALRMQSLLRGEDIVARLGGDEFALVISNLSGRDDIAHLVSRLLKILSDPYHIHTKELSISASIGVSFYPQPNEIDADILLRQADQAMYEAKFNGKNQFHCFDEVSDRSKKVGNDQLSEITSAIENNELILHYQPKVNMRTGEILGAEALVRWNHPTKGILYPDSFLPFIENLPAIYQLDKWVLERVFQQITEFETLHFGKELRFSINLSAYSFKQKDLMEYIETLFSTYTEVSPSQIEFEILETSALHDVLEIQEIISLLHAHGITVSLDDFGTGYASMAYLKKLNVDYLKIDRSFVMDILNDSGDLRILEATIGLAEAFRSSVIAEGVESEAHGELLIQFGCYLAQGYAIAKPMEASLLLHWAATWQPYPSWKERSPIPQKLFPFLYAATEHRCWFDNLNAFIQNKADTPPQQDHTLCQFGKWLHSEGKEMFSDNGEYDELYTLHHQMHELSRKVIRQSDPEATHLNVQAMDELYTLHSRLITYLDTTIQKNV